MLGKLSGSPLLGLEVTSHLYEISYIVDSITSTLLPVRWSILALSLVDDLVIPSRVSGPAIIDSLASGLDSQ